MTRKKVNRRTRYGRGSLSLRGRVGVVSAIVFVSSSSLLLRALALAAEDSLPVGGVLLAVTPPRFGRLVRVVHRRAVGVCALMHPKSSPGSVRQKRYPRRRHTRPAACAMSQHCMSIAARHWAALSWHLGRRTGPHELPHAWPESPCAARMNNGVRIGWERRSRASGRCAIALTQCVSDCFIQPRGADPSDTWISR